MSGLSLPVLFFCLATGAALGCLFLLFQGVRMLLGGGKALKALFDLLFGAAAGGFVFLCALAVDRGFLRLYQAVLQGLGFWAAVRGLGWLVEGAVRLLQKIFGRFLALWARLGRFLRRHFPRPKGPGGNRGKKTGKKTEKQRKKT